MKSLLNWSAFSKPAAHKYMQETIWKKLVLIIMVLMIITAIYINNTDAINEDNDHYNEVPMAYNEAPMGYNSF